MVKATAALLLLPVASAFLAPAPKIAARGRSLNMAFGYDDADRPVGGVQFFPWDDKAYWDPLNLSAGGDEAKIAKFQAAEIKHGRIAMLATLDYFIHGAGIKLPGSLGPVPFDSIPGGLAAVKAVPLEGWGQIVLAVSALEVLARQKPEKVPGNVQPDTPSFPVPGDVETRTKEINNGRLAMVAMLGIWFQEAVNGYSPFEALDALYKV